MSGWTKRQLIVMAHTKIGLASYDFDLEPDMLQSAMFELDAMMGSWMTLGIRIGYPVSRSPGNADLDTVTEIPMSANEAIYSNLALLLGPNFGKEPSASLKATARRAYLALLSIKSTPSEMQLPRGTPAGAGNKRWRSTRDPFLDPPREGIAVGGDTTLFKE